MEANMNQKLLLTIDLMEQASLAMIREYWRTVKDGLKLCGLQ